ncbi:MAG TPA: succinate dehydrogenase iron-sulfur subunit [Thermoplasmata archaeon]
MVVELRKDRPEATVLRIELPQDTTAEPTRTVLLKVYRHNPNHPGKEARMVAYRVPCREGLTVLDALLWVKEHVDNGLAFRYSCRMGICGSCGMLINGKPMLGCETQIADLGTETVEVGPLTNYPVVRDIATDLDDFFRHHNRVKPYLIRTENGADATVEKELLQTEGEKLEYYQFTMCIMCALCDAACPIVGIDQEFLGPQALAQAYRFTADSRDQGWPERREIVDSPHGCYRCELAGSCSAVCPKGVDPAMGVQLLKRAALRRAIRGT